MVFILPSLIIQIDIFINTERSVGVNKNHTSGLNEAQHKERAIIKLPPTNPFSLNLTGKVDEICKQSSVSAYTYVPTTTTVTSSMNNFSNKELISKTRDIFEAFYRITRYPDLATVMEKLSGIWYLDYRVIIYVSGVVMVPQC